MTHGALHMALKRDGTVGELGLSDVQDCLKDYDDDKNRKE